VSNPSQIAVFSGDIDFTTRDHFRAQLAALDSADVAIVDLTNVSYMDSTALAEIVLLHRKRTRSGKTPPRVVVGAKVSRLFDVAGLRAVVRSFDTLAEAQAG
jgi:anti-anti-sigma factor